MYTKIRIKTLKNILIMVYFLNIFFAIKYIAIPGITSRAINKPMITRVLLLSGVMVIPNIEKH